MPSLHRETMYFNARGLVFRDHVFQEWLGPCVSTARAICFDGWGGWCASTTAEWVQQDLLLQDKPSEGEVIDPIPTRLLLISLSLVNHQNMTITRLTDSIHSYIIGYLCLTISSVSLINDAFAGKDIITDVLIDDHQSSLVCPNLAYSSCWRGH